MDEGPGMRENLFEGLRRDVDPAQVRRVLRVGKFLFVLLILFVVVMSTLGPTTEYLWFVHDARHPEVFQKAYSVRSLLFAVAFVAGWAVLYANLRKALTTTMVFLDAPSSRGQLMVTNAISFVQTKGGSVVRLGAPVVALFSALGFADQWNVFLLAQHAQPFGVKDPTFGLDLGFFVFGLPWYRTVATFVCSLLLLTCLATVGTYAGLQGAAALAKIELGRPQIRRHIHLLIGVTVIAYALQLYLKTFEAGLITSAQFTGAGLAEMQGVWIQRLLSYAGVAVGLGIIANGWLWKPYVVPSRGGVGLAAVYFLGVLVYPQVLQKFFVDPDRLAKESPYAAKAIQMTRFAYDLNKIAIKDEAPSAEPTAAEVAASQGTLSNMRLWDPSVLQRCLESYQGIRPYYKFYDVDVDRYRLNGKPTLLMLSPRLLDFTGLQPNAQTWANERLRYTHGYGVVVTRVDQATRDGQPVLLDENVPQTSDPQLKVDQPDIYFGQMEDEAGRPVDEYAIVDTGQEEFDYPTSDAGTTSHWSGDRGIPVGSIFSRLAFSVILGDLNLLVSPEIKGNSRILMHRNVLERASRIYPFLKFDGDPYIVLRGGKLVWVLDGYTTSDMVPYSSMVDNSGATLNYIRNSVKVVIDAYNGETTAYAVDDSEPVLKAWMAAYPGLIHPKSEIPPEIVDHFRYPEDLLNLQASQLCTYHVTDPTVYLSNGDAWNVASQRGLEGEKERIQPFYVEMKLPDGDAPEFVQILPFAPIARINMSGWLAAHCDPGKYGRLTLYRLNQSDPIPGPEQMEGKFNTTPDISNINKQFQNQQSRIIPGNLLVIPIGNSFLYVESLFLQSNTQDLQAPPRLAKVILALKDRDPVVKDSYQEALDALFGAGSTAEPPATPTAPTSATPSAPAKVDVKAIRQALGTLDEADAALRRGDFAKYGELQKKAREELKRLAGP
ncbi:MAG TPA: UPF0182 family protein [Fimbriimonas sp.]|nr:UPF0182 family protein [Fimbriimonas sp.]